MGRDKALIEVGGVACIARVASALAAAGCEPIRIAVAQPEDVERYGSVMPDGLDVEWVLDAVTHAGPIEAVIEALTDPMVADSDSIQLCPVDVPWVTADLFFELEKTLGSGDLLAIPADPQGLIHYLPEFGLLSPQKLLMIGDHYMCNSLSWNTRHY